MDPSRDGKSCGIRKIYGRLTGHGQVQRAVSGRRRESVIAFGWSERERSAFIIIDISNRVIAVRIRHRE